MRRHTCSHTLYNPLIQPCLLHSLPCHWRHRLWSTNARKFPSLILLTFTATRHFSAWRPSTHSVTDEALLASAETSRGASAAHRSGFWLRGTWRPHGANTPQKYGALVRWIKWKMFISGFYTWPHCNAVQCTFNQDVWGVQRDNNNQSNLKYTEDLFSENVITFQRERTSVDESVVWQMN